MRIRDPNTPESMQCPSQLQVRAEPCPDSGVTALGLTMHGPLPKHPALENRRFPSENMHCSTKPEVSHGQQLALAPRQNYAGVTDKSGGVTSPAPTGTCSHRLGARPEQ